MSHSPRMLSVLLLALVALCPAVHAGAQRRGSSGGGSELPVGLGSKLPPPPHPSEARLLPPAEFATLDIRARRRLMMAWAHGSPDNAGAAVLSLIESGLRDKDKDVRAYALAALRRVQNQMAWNLVNQRPVITDPRAHPSLPDTLFGLLDDPDPFIRADVVTALDALLVPPGDAIEGALLSRFPTEATIVRTRIVRALTERARSGSVAARAAVLSALQDPDVSVRDSAIHAMMYLREPEALPVLLREMVLAREPWRRKSVVQVLRAYGEMVRPYVPMVRESLSRETDPSVRAELERLLESVETNRPAR